MSEDPQKLPVPDAPLTASATAESDPVETQLPPADTAELHAPEAGAQEPVPLETVPVLSAGALIRQAREEAGLHIASLAMALKVPVKRLEALEADRFDLLPSAVFSRALASSVCRALKLNPTPVLAQLQACPRPVWVIPKKAVWHLIHQVLQGKAQLFWAHCPDRLWLAVLCFWRVPRCWFFYRHCPFSFSKVGLAIAQL